MTPRALRLIVLTLVLFLVATSAQAILYSVRMKNGTSFDTRYPPVLAEWDPNFSMIMTDRGNWIALANDEIEDVVSLIEEKGFGYQLNTSTVLLGWTPNDLVEDKVDEDGNVIEEARYDPEAEQAAAPPSLGGSSYSINQFLSIPVAGANGNPTSFGGGIPVGSEVGENN